MSMAASTARRSERPGPMPSSRWVVLVEPGFAEHLVAEAQVAAHLNRVGACHRKVELGAPMAGHVVWNRLRQKVGELPPGRPKHRLRDLPGREARERFALELHHELAHALGAHGPGLAPVAEPGRDA